MLIKYLLELSNPDIKYLNIKYLAINTLIIHAASTLLCKPAIIEDLR